MSGVSHMVKERRIPRPGRRRQMAGAELVASTRSSRFGNFALVKAGDLVWRCARGPRDRSREPRARAPLGINRTAAMNGRTMLPVAGADPRQPSVARWHSPPAPARTRAKYPRAKGPLDVLFAVLPFAEVATPAIAASLLQAQVTRAGFSSQVRYFNLDFARRIGVDRYRRIYDEFSARTLLGERIFSELLFQDQLPADEAYLAKLAEEYPRQRGVFRDALKARRRCAAFVQECADESLSRHPHVVGLTTTYQQTCACLAVARRLKQAPDPPVIVLGGANCEGEMGLQLLRSFPWIDYVCTGEGDLVLPAFLRRLLHEGDASPLPGLLKQGDSSELTAPEMVRDLDSLPMPDYADYFEELRRAPDRPDMNRVSVLMQTSRGCWWGAKQHCTFCGLNRETMTFRSKSPEVALRELSHLTETYRARRVFCVDNILDIKYIQTVFPTLIERRSRLKLFYETKANLKFDQLATLHAGGVRWIQPGIESFSNQVLRLMRKGITGLQNIQLLRWCRELGIEALWNIIYGFPGESPSEYARLSKLLPLLVHLQPPQSCTPIRLDRFSPYHNDPEAFGLRNLSAHSYYRYVFPLEQPDLDRLAYYFECEWPEGQHPEEYTGGVTRAFRRWQACVDLPATHRPRLDLRRTAMAVLITDTRPCAVRRIHRLEGLPAEIYLRCDRVTTIAGLLRDLDARVPESQVRGLLNTLLKSKTIVEDEGHYLSLAVWRNRSTWESSAVTQSTTAH